MKETEHYKLKKPEKNEYADIDVLNANAEAIDKTLARLDRCYTTYTPEGGTDGIDYAVDIPGITELVKGLTIKITAHTVCKPLSTNPITLNVNGLGAKPFTRFYSANTKGNREMFRRGQNPWLAANTSVELFYNGENWVVPWLTQGYADDLQGTLSVYHGGTGLTEVPTGYFLRGELSSNNLKASSPEETAADLKPFLPSGKRTCRVVIGTSTAGWTEDDCDYLCDGVDDHVTINNAMQSIGFVRGEVILLEGTYNVAGKVSVLPNVILRGSGKSTVIKGTTAIGGILELAGDSVVKDLNILGSEEHMTSSTSYGIMVNGDNCLIENVRISSCYIGIKNSFVSGVKAHDSKISLCNISDNQYCGIFLRGGNQVGLEEQHLKGVVIQGCCFQRNGSFHLYFQYTVACSIISNNVFYAGVTGIITGTYFNSCIIASNTFCNATGAAISAQDSRDILIIGNSIKNCMRGIDLAAKNLRFSIIGNLIIRGGAPYPTYNDAQYTIRIMGTDNINNLVAYNMILGKNYLCDGGANNTFIGNKCDY